MSAFEDFIQVELPRRPWVVTDPAQESIPVRRGAGPRQLEFVSLTDGQVLGQVSGVVQGVDISTLSGKSYIHNQTSANSSWLIEHNLSSDDFILRIENEFGEQIIPDGVLGLDVNNILVSLASAIEGRAIVIFAT